MNSDHKNTIASLIGLGGLMGVTLLSGILLSSSKVSADGDSAVDEVTITVPTACSMTSTVNTAHTAEIGNGQSNSTIGEIIPSIKSTVAQ